MKEAVLKLGGSANVTWYPKRAPYLVRDVTLHILLNLVTPTTTTLTALSLPDKKIWKANSKPIPETQRTSYCPPVWDVNKQACTSLGHQYCILLKRFTLFYMKISLQSSWPSPYMKTTRGGMNSKIPPGLSKYKDRVPGGEGRQQGCLKIGVWNPNKKGDQRVVVSLFALP